MSISKKKILLVTPELFPLASTGELGLTVSSMAIALKKIGHDVRVVMPAYSRIENSTYVTDFAIRLGKRTHNCILKSQSLPLDTKSKTVVPVYLIGNYEYFERSGLYGTSSVGFADNGERFGFFSRAVLEVMKTVDFQADILHLNDWPTAMAALFMKNHLKDDAFYQKTKIIYTIHNLAYQGAFDPSILEKMDLDWSFFVPSKLEFFWKVNFMKAGLIYADQISTVSESYAQEIQTREHGEGLEGVIRSCQKRLIGITNGINDKRWNPKTDKLIAANFSLKDLEGKKACRKALLAECKLAEKDVPIVCMVSRLAEHKGYKLLFDVLPKLLETEDFYFVFLGEGDERIKQQFETLHQKYPDKTAIFLRFDVELSHRIYAGSDTYLLPAKYEASGIGLLASLRYGVVPVVRRTGGLKDIMTKLVKKTDGNIEKLHFEKYDCDSLQSSLLHSFTLYRQSPEVWNGLIKKIMKANFSWDKIILKYDEIYENLLTDRTGNEG